MLFLGQSDSGTTHPLRTESTTCYPCGRCILVSKAGPILPLASSDDQSADFRVDEPLARIDVAKLPRQTLQHVSRCGAKMLPKFNADYSFHFIQPPRFRAAIIGDRRAGHMDEESEPVVFLPGPKRPR
jgi:hypothetical protein